MPVEEKLHVVYVPGGHAWERYLREGGQGELKARAVSSRQDNLVQLMGLPSYWWKLSDLVPCTPPMYPVSVVQAPHLQVPEPGLLASALRSSEGGKCFAEIPESRLSSSVRHCDLAIEFEEEADEDCEGEECESCNGEGCKQTLDPVLASELLTHLLDSYDNSADSFAEIHGCDRTIVDDMYRDLLVLVSSIRARA